MIEIPFPIDPSERNLPRITVQFQLSSGVFSIIGFPIQGRKSIQNILDTLEIWKPTLVAPEVSLALYDAEFRWSQLLGL